MPLNVLITGAAGYIGSHTTVEILNAGHTAICLDNGVNSYISGKDTLPESLRRVCEITGKELTFYEVDIRHKDQLNQVFKKVSILLNFNVLLDSKRSWWCWQVSSSDSVAILISNIVDFQEFTIWEVISVSSTLHKNVGSSVSIWHE